MLLFVSLLALAQEPVLEPEQVAEPVEVVPEAPVELDEEPTEAPSPVATSDLLDDAGRRIEERDFDGARILIDQAMARPDVDPDRALYLRAVSWEFGGDPATAIPLYDEGLRLYPTGPHALDRQFRKAEALDTLGHSDEALALLKGIRSDELDPRGAHKYDLVVAITTLHAGKRKKGLKLAADALEAVEPDELTFYQAKTRVAYIEVEAARAAQKWDLQAGELGARAHLVRRAKNIDMIEEQATAVAHLDEPEWLLAAVIVLGEAYERLAVDLANHRRPTRLDPQQLSLYELEVSKRVETLRIKGMRTCRVALDMAARIGWQSSRVTRLEELEARLQAAIDG